MAKSNQEIAQEIQSKFQFYLVGLVFTLLGLAIETAKFAGPHIAWLFELFGWVFLFFSGVFGLWRLETVPHVYKLFQADRDLKEGRINFGGEQDEDAAKLQDAIRLWENRIISRYNIHKWLFVIGFACLIVARGFVPFSQLVGCML